MKCTNCHGSGTIYYGSDPCTCQVCNGTGEIPFREGETASIRQDTTTPFNDENAKPVPDKPGVWFYHATRLPVHVTRKYDGELYFKGGKEGEEEMKVSEFARLKENSDLAKFGFTKLVMIVDSPIKPLN